MLQREYQGVRWQLLPEFEPLLAAVLEDAGETVKQSFVTLVTRHRVAGRVFYVKRYRHKARPLSPVKYFVRAPKSHREWKWAGRMCRRGVAVVPHLAHGERWSWRGLLESTLITEGLCGYAVLKDRDAEELSAAPLQWALGRFLRRVHDAGVWYLDLAPQNLLYSSATRAFCLIDVDKVVWRNKLNREERMDNLISLAARMPLTTGFYEGYGRDIAFDAEQIAQRAGVRWRVWTEGVSRRWRKHTHEIARQQVGELEWYIRISLADERLHRIMADPETCCASAVQGLTLRRFRLAAARQAYQEAYWLELMGQATSRPVAVGEKRVCGVCLRSYFVATT